MCSICQDPSYGLIMQQEILKQKYTQVFTFFFSKSINEILQNKRLHHVQIFKEFLFYDDEEEYLQGWESQPISKFANEKPQLQPLLKDLAQYHRLKGVFSCARPIQTPAGQARPQRKRQADFGLPVNGSFLEDVKRCCEERSFETINHDIYMPTFSSDEELNTSPEKKPPRGPVLAKKPHSQIETLPKYVFDVKARKINVSSSVKRSFDTFGSTHYSTNSTKKTDLFTSQNARRDRDEGVQNSMQLDRRPKGVEINNRSSITTSFKSFLNMQILEKAFSKGTQSKSLCKLSVCPPQHMLDVNQFWQTLQSDEHIKIDDQSMKNSTEYKSYSTSMQNSKKKKAQVQLTAAQLFQKLQQCYYDQQQVHHQQTDIQKRQLHPEQQRSLQSLLNKYQKYLSVSPINKSPIHEKTVSQSLASSSKLKRDPKLNDDQCYLYGLKTRTVGSQQQFSKPIERRISFSKRT